MKKFSLFSFFCLLAVVVFAQGNSCEFFVKAYACQDGFSFFRPADAPADKAFDMDTALLRKYELHRSYIYRSLGGTSRFDTSYNYIPWTLQAETAKQSTGNKPYSEVKSVLDPWFANVIENLSKGCLQQLDHSQIFFSNDPESRDLSWAYFYPKQANIAAGASEAEVKAALSEVPSIKIFLCTPIVGTGYFVKYQFQAYQYTKKS